MVGGELVAFFLVTLVFSVTPGPSNLYTVATTTRHGFGAGVQAIIGDQVAGVLYMALAALGLGAVVQLYAPVADALRWAGVTYLVVTGIRTFRAAGRGGAHGETNHAPASPRRGPSVHSVRAFFVTMSNPKAILYFGALFPLFIDFGAPIVPQFLLLAVIAVVVDAAILLAHAAAAALVRHRLMTARATRARDRAVGGFLVAAGAALGASDPAEWDLGAPARGNT